MDTPRQGTCKVLGMNYRMTPNANSLVRTDSSKLPVLQASGHTALTIRALMGTSSEKLAAP
jgi:hypothetical protein